MKKLYKSILARINTWSARRLGQHDWSATCECGIRYHGPLSLFITENGAVSHDCSANRKMLSDLRLSNTKMREEIAILRKNLSVCEPHAKT